MSEFQYYEFLAIDRTLGDDEIAELRRLSTRARITPSSFTNTYDFGDFHGNPSAMMEKYFDAFVYLANWGSRHLMLRLPRSLVDLDRMSASAPETGDCFGLRRAEDFVVLGFFREDLYEGCLECEEWMSRLAGLRAELLGGDLRSLYVGWLLLAQEGELDDDAPSPAPPPGLSDLSGALESLVTFLGIDRDLIDVASQWSAPLDAKSVSTDEFAQWLVDLPNSKKDALLLEIAEGRDPHLRTRLLNRYCQSLRTETASEGSEKPISLPSVAGLLSLAQERDKERRLEEERKSAAKRQAYLDDLATREKKVWKDVENLIQTKKPHNYTSAINLLVDLKDLSVSRRRDSRFTKRIEEIRHRHKRKTALLRRLADARL